MREQNEQVNKCSRNNNLGVFRARKIPKLTKSTRGLCRFAGVKGMMGEGSERGCSSRHEAAGRYGQREENPQPLTAPYDARRTARPPWAGRSDAKRRAVITFRWRKIPKLTKSGGPSLCRRAGASQRLMRCVPVARRKPVRAAPESGRVKEHGNQADARNFVEVA